MAERAKLFLTYEWGQVWVGCDHGREAPGSDPVRICRECFVEITSHDLPDSADTPVGGPS